MPDGTKYADFANTHNYVCGHSSQLVDNVAWNASDPTLERRLGWSVRGVWPYLAHGHSTGYSNSDLVTLPQGDDGDRMGHERERARSPRSSRRRSS